MSLSFRYLQGAGKPWCSHLLRVCSNDIAMLSKMSGFLPVRCSSDIAVHCSQSANAEDPLVWEEGQGSDDRLAPTPPALVRLQELAQPRQVDEDGQDEAVERQESKHGNPERE